MQNSIYTPLSGAIAQERLLDVIAHNLANVNTPGFKGKTVSFSLVEPEPQKNYSDPHPPAPFKRDISEVYPLVGNDIAYAGVSADVRDDDSQGPAGITHSPTDIMIEGRGMFLVQTPDGDRYTRAGNFTLNPNGVLTTQAGHPVQGERGAIVLRSQKFEVNRLGEVYQDGQLVDRLLVYDFPHDASLERTGQNYFYFEGPNEHRLRVDAPSMRQGFLEGSNVNAMKNLTAMILAHRSYEAYQKAVSNFDKMMDKSSNTLGEVRG